MLSEELQQVEPFSDLDEAALERLAHEFVEFYLPAEYPVFQEGVELDTFYVVKEGHVVVYRDVVGKPVQLLARVGPHEYFGEFALFTQSESTISARTTEPCRLLKIEKPALLAFLEGYPSLTLKLQMAAAKRHSISAAAALELGQRNEVRIRIDREVVLTLGDGSVHFAVLDNLSPGGMSLQHAPRSWDEGDDVGFELNLQNGSLPCHGRITWKKGRMVGLAFTDTSGEHERLIQQSLRQLLRPRDVSGDEKSGAWRIVDVESPD